MGTTGRRARIGRHGSEREVCSALAQLALPTDSSPPMDPLPNTSVRAGTDAPFLPMVRRDRAESRAGERPQVSTGRLRETGNEALWLAPYDCLRAKQLTMPSVLVLLPFWFFRR